MAPPPTASVEHVDGQTRAAVRTLLMATPQFRQLDPDRRRTLANALARVCATANHLASEGGDPPASSTPPTDGPSDLPLAAGLAAHDEFGGVATRQLAGTTQRVLDAVSFPRFVEELINGVFTAMVGSSIRQMEAYVDLLDSVAASTDSFANRNLGTAQAKAWLVEQFPDAFEVADSGADEFSGWDDEPGAADPPVRMRSGASFPTEQAIRDALGLAAGESVPTGDPERLVPLVRRTLARKRQEMLGSLVMLGLNRIVVDSGRINASMRFHIDARSAAEDDRGSRFDFRNTANASGRFGAGPWGASASMTNTIGYVKTEQVQTTEELNTSLDLNSSVEINFKSDYLPLSQLASDRQVQQIRDQSRNPAAPTSSEDASRQAQRTARDTRDAARRQAVSDRLKTEPAPTPAPATPAPATPAPATPAPTSSTSPPSGATPR